MKRSFERLAMVSAVIAVIDGARALICMMPVPSRIRVVRAATKASGATASWPHASADQTASTPSRSASTAKLAEGSKSRSRPEAALPMPIAVFMAAF